MDEDVFRRSVANGRIDPLFCWREQPTGRNDYIMTRNPLNLPLFFEFTWPMPEVTEDELAKLQWEEERRPVGSYTIHEIPPRGPLIELKPTTIEEARIEAADHWQKRPV
jgi:hypothetical protein